MFALHQYVNGSDIKKIRKKLMLTQQEFAQLCCVSKKTVEKWEYENRNVQGPVVALLKILDNHEEIVQQLMVPPKKTPLRLWYMQNNEICTIIDVDEMKQYVQIYNFTEHLLKRAFGKNEYPTFHEYEEFLESRCFPRTRDKMKLILKEMDLPYYDPLLIIEKTEGRMAEDEFWIRIER